MKVKRDNSKSERIKNLIKSEKGKVVAVGWFGNMAYDETGDKVASVAATQEFGSPQNGIPSRAFMRPAKSKNEKKWSEVIRDAGARAITEYDNFDYVLDELGKVVTADIKQAIVDVNDPPLSMATLKARAERANKGRKRKIFTVSNIKSKPLQETGHMMDTVTYVVGKKGDFE